MANPLHKIRAFLYENLLTKDNPNDYMARVDSERSLNVKDVCDAAVARGGADISPVAMEHAVTLWFREMGYQLCDGFSVNTGWFTGSVHIRGSFSSPDEQYNLGKHALLFEFHQGAVLRKEIETVTVEIAGVAGSSAVITQVTDVKTGSVNDLLSPNRNLKIVGQKLKLAGVYESVGVYFVPQNGGDVVEVEVSDVVINNPSEVVIVIPNLAAGAYRLQIITQYTGSNLLKDPRTVLFDKILTVP
jgi:hypothetical protein